MYNTACDWIIELNENRIVQAFNDIVKVLIEQVNFTNISVVQRDLELRGERVSYLQE